VSPPGASLSDSRESFSCRGVDAATNPLFRCSLISANLRSNISFCTSTLSLIFPSPEVGTNTSPDSNVSFRGSSPNPISCCLGTLLFAISSSSSGSGSSTSWNPIFRRQDLNSSLVTNPRSPHWSACSNILFVSTPRVDKFLACKIIFSCRDGGIPATSSKFSTAMIWSTVTEPLSDMSI